MKAITSFIAKVDWLIALPCLYLLGMGLVLQASIATKTTGLPISISVASQAIAVLLGVIGVVVIASLHAERRAWFTWGLYGVAVLGLIGVIVAGVEVNGSQRWVSVAGFQFQPTELAKVGLVLSVAKLFDTRDALVNRFRTIVSSLFIVGIPAALILMQPDLGSAIVLCVVWLTILFVSKIKLSLLSLVGIAIIGTVIVLVPFMAEYQQERLVSYFNPERDTAGSGYNVLQASIAIGSGGLTGKGIDSGSQSQLNFLPSQHTDFIFAVAAEKLGFVGALSIIVGFLVIIARLSQLAWRTQSSFDRGVLIGVAAILFFHMFVNIGMNLGLVPVTGLPLPFLSYGGTFMFVVVFAVGLSSVIGSRVINEQSGSKKRGSVF